jgi:hypothetical protein
MAGPGGLGTDDDAAEAKKALDACRDAAIGDCIAGMKPVR